MGGDLVQPTVSIEDFLLNCVLIKASILKIVS